LFSHFSSAGQAAQGEDKRPGNDRGQKGPGEEVAEVPHGIGERRVGKLAAGLVAVGPIIRPIGHSSARTQPNAAQPQNDETPLWSGVSAKRLKGFEPSTFCMATRPGQLPPSVENGIFAGRSWLAVEPDGIADGHGYAAICGVSGTLGEKCPKLATMVKEQPRNGILSVCAATARTW
jgi:hypothetical protein